MEKKEKILKIVYVVVLFLLGGGLIFWGLNGGGYWPLIIGVFFLIAFIATFIRLWYELKTGVNNDDFSTLQVGIGCFLPIAFFIAVQVFELDDVRFISPRGSRLHIMKDCSSLQSSSDIKEVSRLEGWFHWVFKDCKVCEERKDAENEAKRIERRKNRAMETRQELIEYYEEKLEYVQEKLDKLKNCDDPDEIFKEEKIMEANEYPDEEYDDIDLSEVISNR